MTSPPEGGASSLDRAVELLARGMDAVGMNGTRLRWKWNRRKREIGETKLRTAVVFRSATTPYKMCRSCRALVPRSASVCPECGAGLAAVRAPGLGRLFSNVIPGATATTSLLLLANGAMFALMLMVSLSSGTRGGLLSSFDPTQLSRFGAGLGVLTIQHGDWYRLITPIFLHGGLLHFAFNTYALLQIGPLVEEEYGTERFAVVYVASGIGGNVFSQLLRPYIAAIFPLIQPQIWTVGASGAICGLIGLMLVYGIRRGGTIGSNLRSGMSQYALYILVFSFLPGIDGLCHLGGFIGGFVLGWVVPAGPFRSRLAAAVWNVLVLACLIVVLVAFYQAARD